MKCHRIDINEWFSMIKANFKKNINLPSSLNMQSANLISTKVRSVAITLPRTWQVFGERLLVERFNTVLPRFSVDSKLKINSQFQIQK